MNQTNKIEKDYINGIITTSEMLNYYKEIASKYEKVLTLLEENKTAQSLDVDLLNEII